MSILFDTDVLIHHLRGGHEGNSVIGDAIMAGGAHFSVPAQIKIEGGTRSPERAAVRQAFSQMNAEHVTSEVATLAGEFMRQYRSHHTIAIPDYVTAATAFVRGHVLATPNVRHFPMVEGLKAPW